MRGTVLLMVNWVAQFIYFINQVEGYQQGHSTSWTMILYLNQYIMEIISWPCIMCPIYVPRSSCVTTSHNPSTSPLTQWTLVFFFFYDFITQTDRRKMIIRYMTKKKGVRHAPRVTRLASLTDPLGNQPSSQPPFPFPFPSPLGRKDWLESGYFVMLGWSR